MYIQKLKTGFCGFLATLVVGAFIFNACSETTTEEMNNNFSSEIQTSFYEREGVLSPENPSNPWDIYGAIHNEILQEVVDNHSSFGNDTSIAVNFALLRFGEKYDPVLFGGETSLVEIQAILQNFPNSYHNVVNTYSSNQSVRSKLNDLFDIIYNSFDEDSLNYNIMKDRILSFEENILNDTQGLANTIDGSTDMSIVLKTTSIARYSFYFWYLNTNERSTPGYDYEVHGKKKRKWWKWLVVGAADVAGGVTGGVGGALGASAGASTLVDWVVPDEESEE